MAPRLRDRALRRAVAARFLGEAGAQQRRRQEGHVRRPRRVGDAQRVLDLALLAQRPRALEEQPRLAAAAHLLAHGAVASGLLHRDQRVGPAACPRLHLQQRRQHPGRLGPEREGALREFQGACGVAGPLGLNEQAAQPEKRRRRLIEHGLEVAARGLVVALQLRRLRREQQRQRRLVQHQVGAAREPARALGIARRGGDQALRQRAVAETLAAAAARQGDAAGGRSRRSAR